ncbi:MAG: DNA-directed RNA polymerase subunit beta' [Candidatus Terrybacteria bacterium RIFCSPLOWO2_01_FULL_58_14]|uniref:DNA-directed RNA polymerase subunit beta' n=2 Tax=Candidatus Terryibacteriota TaxID=1817920 RepID=A0A1G2PVD4_9BACT|nr:MAG: DNA-directed RNA polymerase subunit beta' [Candidatus Terrybacteria bacterium RIFCSPHIGHO2_01_FULL_58_15]OHA52296.1 MAG: DNA-directed RNA polymerase subunit beta' [Candidatus Terrybacteria bacterium RIFCSPLOWO2_01_FULL_58_14]
MPTPIPERPTRVTDFDTVALRLASPDEVRAWSHGEVTKAETINYRTQRPEKDGLFDERIFGPERDFECYCGKYKRVRFKGIVCDKCGVEVTRAAVRRERMGHIELATPVTHIWFLKSVPSRIGLLLDISAPAIERVVYFNGYIVTRVDDEARKRVLKAIAQEFKQKTAQTKDRATKTKLKTAYERAVESVKGLQRLRVFTEPDYFDLSLRYAEVFSAGTGAEILRDLLAKLDLDTLAKQLASAADQATPMQQRRILRRLRLVRALRASGVHPEWMILTVLPVLPPDLRPMVQLDGGRFATSDLNDLYRRVINRNNRLKHLQSINAPEVIQRNEKRMLQEAVDALIDNSMRKGPMGPATGASRRPLRSLADMLRGKQGRFRQNLLGKRVDYSARSVIVVGSDLALHECGLPKTMAMELFKPFVVQKLLEREHAFNIRGAIHLIEEGVDVAWGILEEVIADKYVLLNRAPTLHRLSVQAFRPRLIEGEAIQIHPLVCPAFNADFDGDQMAVHVPISRAAQREAAEIMIASHNLLKPANGLPIAVPRQDIVLGIYLMTRLDSSPPAGAKGESAKTRIFANPTEATLVYHLGGIQLTEVIRVRLSKPIAENPRRLAEAHDVDGLTETNVGRVLFNEVLPPTFPFVNAQLRARDLEELSGELIRRVGIDSAARTLDAIKNLGFEYATRAGVSWGMDDLAVPQEKPRLIAATLQKVSALRRAYEEGLLTNDERRERTIALWRDVTDEIGKRVPETIDSRSSVFSIVDSGAKGSWTQPRQMAGMKGPVVNPAGQIMEVPIVASFTEGFNVLEYFISTHAARKGATDTALRTATAGYLTRRLVDVAQEVIVAEEDCGDGRGIALLRKDSEETGQEFVPRLIGRVAVEDVRLKRKREVRKGETIDHAAARVIADAAVEEVRVRSPLTCRAVRGVCRLCYGWDLGRNELVAIGEAVGVVAAQAIGEPGTQLTMRTFHTGGVAVASDITQGLLRVEEIFEARPPKGQAILSEVAGSVAAIREESGDRIVEIVPQDRPVKGVEPSRKKGSAKPRTRKQEKAEAYEIRVPRGIPLIVQSAQRIEKGQPVTRGSIDLKELYRLTGLRDTECYIIREVQRIYAAAGAVINDKHIEIIVRQMFSRMRVKSVGETALTLGEILPRPQFQEICMRAEEEGKKEPEAVPLLLGITMASLASESFLASASFQETARVLIQAGLEGARDRLRGLKENVIIGRLIPAGTGYRREYAADAYIGTVAETRGAGEFATAAGASNLPERPFTDSREQKQRGAVVEQSPEEYTAEHGA